MGDKKLAVIVLGHKNSGKSHTWYELFGRVIRSGYKRLNLGYKQINPVVKNSSFEETDQEIEDYIDPFVQNSSFEENGGEIENWFDEDGLPDIFFCSVQYSTHGIQTINWLKEKGYYLYIQWLNPGYHDKEEYADSLDFENKFQNSGQFERYTGKEKIDRTIRLKKFLTDWVTNNR